MLKRIKQNLANPKALVIFLSFLILIFLIDGLTKHFIFDSNLAKLNSPGSDYSVIGLRSYPHDNSTVFSSLNVDMPLWSRILINIALAVVFTIPMLFTRSIFLAIGLGILVGAILGNGLDIISARPVDFPTKGVTVTHYVRDVFYTPWADKGTFNAADVFVIIGAGLVFIRTFLSLFKKEN